MLHSTDYRELRNGKGYQKPIERNHGSTEENANEVSAENVKGKIPVLQTLTQEAVNEQVIGFMAPLTRPPARGVDSAGPGNVYLKASLILFQD